ncbi:MAG: branched-chain amino acid ABC transporter permease [Dehalococcoidia bacterium]|nr:branched-chain amino acid ABC transporter permease [Dehalococcoidia bacterium]
MGLTVASWFEVLINGFELGFIYALVALGFSLIYGVGRIIFCTHGEIYMMGAMFCYLLITRLSWPYPLALFSVTILTGIFGLILDRALFRRFYGNDFNIFIVSLALAMIIANSFMELFGPQAVGITEPFPGIVSFLTIDLARDKLIVAVISVGLILALKFFFDRAKAGQAIRAVAQDPEAASLQGINKSQILSLTFFLSLAVAGAAGALVAPLYSVSTSMGQSALLDTFIVVILGGLGSFPGAILGGLLLGLLQSIGTIFIGHFAYLVSFTIVIIFLVIKPQGFFGHA